MGYAVGNIMKTISNNTDFIPRVWSYLKQQAENALPSYFPKWLDDLIATVGLDVALDLTYDVTVPYTNPSIYQTIRGVADASGNDYDTIVRVHMLAGLTQGKCSMFGAWGKALSDPTGLLQLRALDWDMDGPFRDYSAITVFHPTDGDGHDFANIGFAGFIGAITGISSTNLAISEIGVAFPDSSFGSESRIGIPFIFLLRDILAYDQTLDDSINRMSQAPRTCDLILGVGDGKLNQFRGFAYSSSVLHVYDDKNMMPYNETWHPRIPDLVYWGMDWLCPGYNILLSNQLKKYYGQLTPEIGIKYISAVEQSGDNQVVFYDLKNKEFYVSFAAPFKSSGPTAAYDRQYTKLSATALFAEQPPK
eukprot:TRINITY_DN2208_c0_g1_i1.p1 TRINITY_DN2208_c0_g1~~TRINITY_DN2208_c0_g1_i1.p1  ORF type:complete len:363 (-),score=85.76 TRINITY_DN2208_c0_g1_i1:40-1128(-)